MLKYLIEGILKFIFWKIMDVYRYFKNREWEKFRGFGLHIYVGMFGMGKTSAMVHDAYNLASRYKMIRILTNMTLKNFPKWTVIEKLVNYRQIVDAPKDTLIILDEISSVFNSRQWKNEGIPAPLLSTLLQVRKEHKMMYATAQRFIHVDALFRQITFTVRDCECWRGRWNWIRVYDGYEYEHTTDMRPAEMQYIYAFIQSDAVRGLYDTEEMVDKMSKAEYITDAEILAKQGMITSEPPGINVDRKKRVFGRKAAG